jgi:branched-chain amino acid aminotransferase
MMAAQQSHSRGFDDVFIANQYQRPVETSIANVFWVKDGTIFTPPLTEGCVAGVMRRHVLAASASLGFTVKEAILTKKQLFEADEAFLTNAIRRIKWIEEIEGYRYSNELTASLHAALFKIPAGS